MTQLVTTFCRGAMTERSGALQEDLLYMSYAQIAAKSCGEEEEDGGNEEGGEEGDGSTSIHVSFIYSPNTNLTRNQTLNKTNQLYFRNAKHNKTMEKLIVSLYFVASNTLTRIYHMKFMHR